MTTPVVLHPGRIRPAEAANPVLAMAAAPLIVPPLDYLWWHVLGMI